MLVQIPEKNNSTKDHLNLGKKGRLMEKRWLI